MTTKPQPDTHAEVTQERYGNTFPAPFKCKASVIIVCTNELSEIKRCLPSVINQSYPNYEVLLVDNGSNDGSPEYVERNFKGVRVIRNGANLGYAGANNRGFHHAAGEYLVVLNPDTEVDQHWLAELVHTMDTHPQIGLATSRICFLSNKDVINTCGNDVNFTGLAFCRGIGEPKENYEAPELVPAVSGCAFAIRRSILQRIGGFDEDFFIYLEDTDLSVRARLAGYRCAYVPTSVVYHDYAFNLGSWKFFHLERNRHLLLLKNFQWRTLLMMSPALLLTEILTLGYGAIHGGPYLLAKLRAYKWVVSNLPKLMRSRSRVQALRVTSDKEIIRELSFRIPFERLTSTTILNKALQIITFPFFRFLQRLLLLVAKG